MIRTPLIILLLGSLGLPRLSAEELQGADAVLKRLAEAAKSPAPKEKAASTPAENLQEKMNAYLHDSATLPPDEAAARWLAMYESYIRLSRQDLYRRAGPYGRLNFQGFVEMLPPSAAWPALVQRIDERKPSDNELADAALRLFGSLLRGTPNSRARAMTSVRQVIQKRAKRSDGNEEYLNEMLEQFTTFWNAQTGSDADRLAGFEKNLVSRETQPKNRERGGERNLAVPDLVRLAGEARATLLLQRVLKLNEDLSFEGKSTRHLAASLALKNIATLQKPLWDLVEAEADIPLYKALAAKFPDDAEGGPFQRGQADMVYLLHLIASGETKEAAGLALKILGVHDRGASLFGQFMGPHSHGSIGKAELAFLREMLSREPSLPLWSDFIALSAQLGEPEQALAFLKSSMALPGLSNATQMGMKEFLFKALLAADKVEDGISALRELVRVNAAAKEEDAAEASDEFKKTWAKFGVQPPPEVVRQLREAAAQGGAQLRDSKVDLPLRLMELGRLLKRPELVEEGLAAARVGLEKIPSENYQRLGQADRLVEMLASVGRLGEAEAVAVEELAREVKPHPEQGGYMGNFDQLQTALMWIYLKSGRAGDAVKLLEQSPYWSQPDLAGISTAPFQRLPLQFIAARALASTGRSTEARQIAMRHVQNSPGTDAAYELVLAGKGAGLETWLDQVFAIDHFEERPLIWKAKLQMDAGRLNDAEKTVRAAIAIDPSDGEEGKGNRMRAYAVLGDILERKNDFAQAKIMRSAVSAIRLSEDADDWWQADLLTHAIKMYEDALNQFADAYCIQSRLALRYSEQGDFAKAEQHYQRAFELMPESFGRLESHCFGCEGAFAGQRAQNIAERVFTALSIKMPDRPQVFYLLGYLREAQDRAAEAGQQYRKAVALDPDYLNAWSKLAAVADSMQMSPEDRGNIALAILRIDPAGKHSSPSVQDVRDLAKLWDVLLASERALPKPETGPMFSLPASRIALQARQPGQNWDLMLAQMQENDRHGKSPRRHLVQSQVMGAIASLLEMATQMP